MATTKVNTNQVTDPLFNSSMARQAIINGNFDVWQRGVSFTLGAAAGYTADRWYGVRSGAVTGEVVTQQAIVSTELTGSNFCARVQRVNGNTGTEFLSLSQSFESISSKLFIGKKLTLSFWARKGANFSSTSDILISEIHTGTGTDQNVYITYTGDATLKTQNNTLTSSWQKFTMTTDAIGTSVTEFALTFKNTPVGTAGAADYFEITQVQLCAGDVALPFMPKSFEEELRACQRYCQAFTGDSSTTIAIGSAATTTIALLYLKLITTMRIAPTITATAGDWQLQDGVNANVDLTAISIQPNTSGKDTLQVRAEVASGLTQYRPYILVSDQANRLMIFSSEL